MESSTAIEDPTSGPMEALERRLAVAKAQLLLQQKMNGGDRKELVDRDSSSVKQSHQPDSFRLKTPFKKDVEENDLSYQRLSHPINDNLLSTDVKFSSAKGSTMDKLLHDLLQNGDSAQKYMQGSRSMRIDNWVLLDNFVQSRGSSSKSHLKAVQKNSKRSKGHMSMKQLKKHGALNFPKDLQRFDAFKPMHDMWESYMMQLIKATGKNQLPHTLLTTDFHGAFILVADCKITSLTGVCGIMVRETAETFGIITRDDKFRVVPKKVSVFVVHIDCWKVTLLGDKLSSRKLVSQR